MQACTATPTRTGWITTSWERPFLIREGFDASPIERPPHRDLHHTDLRHTRKYFALVMLSYSTTNLGRYHWLAFPESLVLTLRLWIKAAPVTHAHWHWQPNSCAQSTIFFAESGADALAWPRAVQRGCAKIPTPGHFIYMRTHVRTCTIWSRIT